MAAAGESESSEPELPKWALLDRFVFTRFDLAACGGEDGGGSTTTTTSPLCCTSQGVPFRISLRLSAPPATSRFYLHMLPGSADHHCRILGSHRDALLFVMYVLLPDPLDPQGPSRFFKQEMFVYTAGGSTSPTVTQLPPCTASLDDDDDDDYYDDDDDDSFPPSDDDDDGSSFDVTDDRYNPLAGFVQFSDIQAVGVLCNTNNGSSTEGDDDYVVAYLCLSGCITPGSGAQTIEARMYLYYSSESKWWELHALPISYRTDKDLHELIKWSTSRVVACGTYLCWVDYNCGILFCQLFDNNERRRRRLRVTYLSLPVVDAHCCFRGACMDTYRSICAVAAVQDDHEEEEGGTIVNKLKFFDVTPSHGYILRPPPSDGFELNIWTFRWVTEEDGSIKEQQDWRHELVIQDSELRISDLVPSPHGPLTLPVISMEEPHVAYFAVGEHGYCVKKVWIVPVDLIGRSPKHASPYLKGEDDLLGDDADLARKKPYCFEPFIPCHVSLFFPQVI